VIRLVLNDDHLKDAIGQAVGCCRHRLFLATADVKDLHFPAGDTRRAYSILDAFEDLSARGVEIRLLHSGVPSEVFLRELKEHFPANLVMRRCPRVHVKAVIADGRAMYLGSANLTGAGLGAKSARRRNFEAGIWTDEVALIDPVLDMLDGIWTGRPCRDCGRKSHCPVPLEEPDL
jgi:phosphatidylserine/phosphatidylglycerophosphate/cardiolipin synthase-like enzyme